MFFEEMNLEKYEFIFGRIWGRLLGKSPAKAKVGAGVSIEQKMAEMGPNGLLPTQDWIHAEQLAFYRETLKQGGSVKPILAYRSKGKLFIEEGHHRYLAGQLEGIAVPVNIHNFGGPVGLPNWSGVKIQSMSSEMQPINTSNIMSK